MVSTYQTSRIRNPDEEFFEELRRRIAALQQAVEGRDGQTLIILYDTPSGDRIRVGAIGYRRNGLFEVRGRDLAGDVPTIVYTGASGLQLVAKVIAPAPDEPERRPIGFFQYDEPPPTDE